MESPPLSGTSRMQTSCSGSVFTNTTLYVAFFVNDLNVCSLCLVGGLNCIILFCPVGSVYFNFNCLLLSGNAL